MLLGFRTCTVDLSIILKCSVASLRDWSSISHSPEELKTRICLGLNLSGSVQGQVVGSDEHDNESLYDPGGHVVRIGEWRCVYRILVGQPPGNRPLGKPRHRWKDNITMGLQEMGRGGMN